MKINRFNESVDENYEKDIYEEFENSDQLALYFYNASGWIGNVILFTNWDDLGNYVINYVNAYILDIYEKDIADDFEDADPDHICYDSDGVPCFTSWDSALEYINEMNEDGRGITLGFAECKQAKDIEIDERVKLLMNKTKYNL